ncbi:uncharacterized protein N7506_007465 [Penicillium brevicompactum]|uniref:uncharacterized protein n=1 Tax=Penicillium brevicompactum TaxID=5074 RepID=UPI0025408112|nr:uncharacterized protein N7506_007465 [Penicillium brevicompactum]KAJ5333682.1 hypothetical protein N7506_007465 [Penicillium brevicompactum]
MRFLCSSLHGVGTNSKPLCATSLAMDTPMILWKGCSPMSWHRVRVVHCGHAGLFADNKSEIRDIVPANDQGFSYFDPESVSASLQAVHDLETLIEEDGPYDAVLAFSQGMMLACTLLMHLVQEKKPLPVKCAVFFSPRMAPLNYVDLQSGAFTEIDANVVTDVIEIPTALVWGSRDPCAGKAVELKKIFQSDTLSTVVHEGSHEVPGYAFKDALMQAVKVIRRTIDLV